MSRVQKTCCKIPILLSHLWWVNAMWYIHNALTQSLFLTRSTHDSSLFWKLIWVIPNICWGAAVSPPAWVSPAAAQNPGKPPWHGILMGLGSPSSQSPYTGCWLFQGQEKKPHTGFFLCAKLTNMAVRTFFCAWGLWRRALGKWEHALINNSSGMSVIALKAVHNWFVLPR